MSTHHLKDVPYWDYASQELHHLLCMAARTIEEIETIANLLDRYRILLRAMLQDELLEEEEGPLMRDLLPDLH